jgi:hypothetical protein
MREEFEDACTRDGVGKEPGLSRASCMVGWLAWRTRGGTSSGLTAGGERFGSLRTLRGKR